MGYNFSKRTEHFTLPKQWASMRVAKKLEQETGKKIINKEALVYTIKLAKEAGELASKFLKKPHDLEYEKTFYPFILISKKRYTGDKYEFSADETPKRTSMGLVTKRRDNAPIVKDIYGGVIDILMKEQVVHKAVDFVKKSLQDVVDEKFPQTKLVITKAPRSYYKNPMQIAHNVLAMRIGERDPGNKPKPGDRMKFVYVKNEKGNVVKVTFGDPNMEIKRDDPGRLKSFRARHNCDNPGPKTKARYWSCRAW